MRNIRSLLFTLATLVMCLPLLGHAAPNIKAAEAAELRGQLPKGVLAYLRIPNLWGVLAVPKGNALAPALASKPYQQQFQKIQQAVNAQLLPEMEQYIGPAVTIALKNLRAPLEVILVRAENVKVPVPNLLMASKLDAVTLDEANQILTQFASLAPVIDVLKPIAADGYGVLMVKQVPVFVHYNLKTQALHVMSGVAASQQVFIDTLTQLQPNRHAMHDLENQMDSSHQGLFMWLDAKNLAPVLQASMPPHKARKLAKIGFFDMNALALGWGVSNKKSRLKLVVDAPQAIYHKMLPGGVQNKMTVTTTGTPDVVMSMSMPFSTLLTLFEQFKVNMNAKNVAEYQQFKIKFQDIVGLSLSEVVSLFSGEIIYFSDKAGDFSAIRITDMAKFDQTLTRLIERFDLPYHEIKQNGITYHHLVIDSVNKYIRAELKNTQDPTTGFFLGLMYRINSHLFWVKEGDYLVLASVPQPLMDRHSQQAKKPLSLTRWLKHQGHQASNALFLVSTKTKNMPRAVYYLNLQVLQALSDLAKANIDLFQFPTAWQLELAKLGNYGLQLDFSQSAVSLEFIFESNPLEFLGSSSNAMMGVAAVGILSAIAIPAYQDYAIRAKVSSGLHLATSVKTAVSEHYASTNILPIDNAAAGLPAAAKLSNQQVASIMVDHGMIVIQYSYSTPQIGGKKLILMPYVTERGTINWQCGYGKAPVGKAAQSASQNTSIRRKYLPSACR